ncbi:unnamed protein product [Closterium sp. Yama58-4]|nr:unnamed protein product [Closterium sp. Yama58-4]
MEEGDAAVAVRVLKERLTWQPSAVASCAERGEGAECAEAREGAECAENGGSAESDSSRRIKAVPLTAENESSRERLHGMLRDVACDGLCLSLLLLGPRGTGKTLDADQLLEKRVRSRFSNRKIVFLPPQPQDLVRLLLSTLTLPVQRPPPLASALPNTTNASAALLQASPTLPNATDSWAAFATAFNEKVELTFQHPSVLAILLQSTAVNRTAPHIFKLGFRAVCEMVRRGGQTLSVSDFERAYAATTLPIRQQMLSGWLFGRLKRQKNQNIEEAINKNPRVPLELRNWLQGGLHEGAPSIRHTPSHASPVRSTPWCLADDLPWRDTLKGFDSFLKALESSGASKLIDAYVTSPFGARTGVTFLAPTDDAFAAMPPQDAEMLRTMPWAMASQLLFHVVKKRLTHVQLRSARPETKYGTLSNVALVKVYAPILEFGPAGSPYGPQGHPLRFPQTRHRPQPPRWAPLPRLPCLHASAYLQLSRICSRRCVAESSLLFLRFFGLSRSHGGRGGCCRVPRVFPAFLFRPQLPRALSGAPHPPCLLLVGALASAAVRSGVMDPSARRDPELEGSAESALPEPAPWPRQRLLAHPSASEPVPRFERVVTLPHRPAVRPTSPEYSWAPARVASNRPDGQPRQERGRSPPRQAPRQPSPRRPSPEQRDPRQHREGGQRSPARPRSPRRPSPRAGPRSPRARSPAQRSPRRSPATRGRGSPGRRWDMGRREQSPPRPHSARSGGRRGRRNGGGRGGNTRGQDPALDRATSAFAEVVRQARASGEPTHVHIEVTNGPPLAAGPSQMAPLRAPTLREYLPAREGRPQFRTPRQVPGYAAQRLSGGRIPGWQTEFPREAPTALLPSHMGRDSMLTMCRILNVAEACEVVANLQLAVCGATRSFPSSYGPGSRGSCVSLAESLESPLAPVSEAPAGVAPLARTFPRHVGDLVEAARVGTPRGHASVVGASPSCNVGVHALDAGDGGGGAVYAVARRRV